MPSPKQLESEFLEFVSSNTLMQRLTLYSFAEQLEFKWLWAIQLEADTCLEDHNPNVESNQRVICRK